MFDALKRPNQLKSIATLRMGCSVGKSVTDVEHKSDNISAVMGVALFTDLLMMSLEALIINFVW